MNEINVFAFAFIVVSFHNLQSPLLEYPSLRTYSKTCMSILAYQEVERRIEELTWSIYELDPYYNEASDDEPAATLAMLVSSADRARASRRSRAVPPPPARLVPAAPSPARLAPTTYAEIVKGSGSRSVSPPDRPTHRMPLISQDREASPEEDTKVEVHGLTRPRSLDDRVEFSEPKSSSDTECEMSVCDTFPSDVNVYSREYSHEVCDYYVNPTVECNEKVPELNIVPQQPSIVEETPIMTTTELRPPDCHDRSMSPASKHRSQELSYAEILALGLSKQLKNSNVSVLPKPQVAQVEMVKEIVIEMEKSPSLQHEQKLKSKDSLKLKGVRPERPSQRSRSRDMPRQRRAPEKRSMKTNDAQLIKKKKTPKKVLEVQEFDDNPEVIDADDPPSQSTLALKHKTDKKSDFESSKMTVNKIETEKEKPIHIENFEEPIDASPEQSVAETVQKKSKKKNKIKKAQGTEDEIERALKEIEESDKQKKKKHRDLRDKSKEKVIEVKEVVNESRNLDVMLESKESMSSKSKKKKSQKHQVVTSPVENIKEEEQKFINSKLKETQEIFLNDMTQNELTRENVTKTSSLKCVSPDLNISADLNDAVSGIEFGSIKQKKKKKSKKQDKVQDTEIRVDPTEEIKSLNENTDLTKSKVIDNTDFKDMNILEKIQSEQSLITEDNESSINKSDESSNKSKTYRKKSKTKKSRGTDNEETDKAIKKKEQDEIIKTNKDKKSLETVVESMVDTSSSQLKIENASVSEIAKNKIITMDWNALMEEEDKIPESAIEPITLDKNQIDINISSEQIASEVTILPEVTTVLSESDIVDCVKLSESCEINTSSDQSVIENLNKTTATENEQNNNDKFYSDVVRKERFINVIEQTTTYRPIDDVETRTIYLITHEEKKMPPIRTVKIFNSKNNSFEESCNEKTIPIESEKAENEEESLQSDKVDVEISDLDSMNKIEVPEKSDTDSHVTEETLDNFQNMGVKNTDVVEELEGVNIQYDHNVPNKIDTKTQHVAYPLEDSYKEDQNLVVVMNIEKESKNIETSTEIESDDVLIEQAIFGSVQQRRKPVERSEIPGVVINEEVKPYMIGLDFEQLDYNYYQYISNKTGSDVITSLKEGQVDNDLSNEYKEKNYIAELEKQEGYNEEHVETNSISEKIQQDQASDNVHVKEFNSGIDDISEIITPSIKETGLSAVHEISPEKSESLAILEDMMLKYDYQNLRNAEYNLAIQTTNKHALKLNKLNNTNVIENSISEREVEENSTEILSADNKDIMTKSSEIKNDTTDLLIFNSCTQLKYNYQDIIDAENKVIKENSYKQIQENTLAVDESLDEAVNAKINASMSNTNSENNMKILNVTSIEVPRHQYQELSDAEQLYANIKSCQDSLESDISFKNNESEKATNYEPSIDKESIKHDSHTTADADGSKERPQSFDTITDIRDDDISNVTNDCNQNEMKLIYEIPMYSYSELRDAENLLITRLGKEYQSKIEPTVQDDDSYENKLIELNVNSTSCENITKGVRKSSEHEYFIFEVPGQNYKELQDAEYLYASLCSKNAVDIENSNRSDVLSSKENQRVPLENKDFNDDCIGGDFDIEEKKVLASVDTEIVENKPDCTVENIIKKGLEKVNDESKSPEDTILEVTIQENIMPEKTEIAYTIDLISHEQSVLEENDNIGSDIVGQIDKEPNNTTDLSVNMSKLEKDTPEENISNFEDDYAKQSLVPLVFDTPKSEKGKNSTLDDSPLNVKEDEEEEFVIVDVVKDVSEEIVNVSPVNFDSGTGDIPQSLAETEEAVTENNKKQYDQQMTDSINLRTDEKLPDYRDNLPLALDFEVDCEIIKSTLAFDKEEELLQAKHIKESSIESNYSSTENICLLPDTTIESQPIDTQIRHNILSTDENISTLNLIESTLNKTNENLNIPPNIDCLNTDEENDIPRPEKSPIHSLHDLLPEIDSIPEFKPAYSSSTVLYSKLSADAPEFKPSYMYSLDDNNSSESVSNINLKQKKQDTTKSRNDVESTPGPENTLEPITASYSSVLLSKAKEPQDKPKTTSQSLEKKESGSKPPTVQEKEEHPDTKSKPKKRKKKDLDKRDSSLSFASDTDNTLSNVKQNLETTNVWTKAAEEGKSYAEVVAEGLIGDEQKDLRTHQHVDPPIVSDQEMIPILSDDSLQVVETKQENPKGADESQTSWAKIVASNRPSPERVSKVNEPIVEITSSYKPPVILVDESDNEIQRSDVHVDDDGFIKVDRNRRSRSRSRDNRNRSPSTSKTIHKQLIPRDKSENRFEPLVSILKTEEESQDVESAIEKETITKVRKNRSSLPKEEIKTKTTHITPNPPEEEKQQIKKDKKKKITKSKDKTLKSNENKDQIEPALDRVMEDKVEPTKKIEPQSQKKNKGKKKDKKNSRVIDEANTPVEPGMSSLEQEKLMGVGTRKDLTPVSTPEIMQTPIKDKPYSEAQFWKIDPSGIDELSNLSEILTIEVNKQEVPKLQLSVPETKIDETVMDAKTDTETLCDVGEDIQSQISEEQSLENKMADLQREIEEMLLPENDNSITSNDDIQIELTQTNISIEEQQDEIPDSISPMLASPDPEDILLQTNDCCKENVDVSKSDHIAVSMADALLEESNSKRITDKTSDYIPQHEVLEELSLNSTTNTIEQNILENRTNDNTNLLEHTNSSAMITNNTIYLKPENFRLDKFVTDDAEKRLAEQNNLIVTKDVDEKLEKNLMNDKLFWLEKHLYHDAECQYFISLANQSKESANIQTDLETKDEDKDPDGGSGFSSNTENNISQTRFGSPSDSNYISMDLPGGICSWKDQSSYLSVETPTDSLSQLVSDIPEDTLTPLSPAQAAPSPLPPPAQEPTTPERIPKAAKDDLSNDIETLLEEVKIVQSNLSDLPDGSLDAMEEGLREGISILEKCDEAAVLLEQKIMEFREEPEVKALLRELVSIRGRIAKLLVQARQGLNTIQDARVQVAKQTKELEEQKEKVAKLDRWLENINEELKESTQQADVLTDEDIVRYIEIYERYIREYEEYEVLLKSVIVVIYDDSSHLKMKLDVTRKSLETTKDLVIKEIERLRQLLIQIRTAPEVVEDDISQTDRTIDSTSMPEEIVSPREMKYVPETIVAEVSIPEKKELDGKDKQETGTIIEDIPEQNVKSKTISKETSELRQPKTQIQEVVIQEQSKPSATIETQTGKSLQSETPDLVDRSVTCAPEKIITHDVSITCIPQAEVEVQTSEPKSLEEILENIQVKQTTSDGHETIEIASRPVTREQKMDEQSLFVDAHYQDDKVHKDSHLNIVHSLPQSFETVMVEPDETTTEVIVDADGTKRIIVKKVRKTLVTRQQIIQSHQQESHVLSTENIPQHSFSQLTLEEEGGSKSSLLEDGGQRHMEYQIYDGKVISALPGSEVTIEEVTSRPDVTIAIDQGIRPEEILQLAEGEIQPQIKTSSSVTAVVQQITKRIVKTRRRVIRRVVIIDGKEHVTEEIIDEPDNVEIFEEKIPRVSINVKESETSHEFTVDPDDKDKFPPEESPNSNEDTKNLQYERKSEKHESPFRESSEDKIFSQGDQPLESRTTSNITYPEDNEVMKRQLKEIIQKECNVVLPGEPKSSTEPSFTIPETVTHIVSDDEQITNIPSDIQSTETTSSATMIQRVIKTVKRKRRIIKHIQIIDGKEQVTEEIIEEPDDEEVVEGEPTITYTQNPEFSTKCIKIIRQVCVKDGKEHVTEQIVEEPEDDLSEATKVITIEKPEISEFKTIEEQHFNIHKGLPRDQNIPEISKQLLGSEIDVSPSQIQHSIPNMKEQSQAFIENEQIDNSPRNDEKRDISTYQTPVSGERSKINKQAVEYHSETPKTEVTKSQDTEERSFDIGLAEVVSSNKEMLSEPDQDTSNDNVITKITKKKTRVIRHIQIIDGKEHVTEEVIQEPDEVQFVEGDPGDSHVRHDEFVKTKSVKILRQVQIIDGKEHVTEKVIESSDNEYVPESTDFDSIQVPVQKPDVVDVPPQSIPTNETIILDEASEGSTITEEPLKDKKESNLSINEQFLNKLEPKGISDMPNIILSSKSVDEKPKRDLTQSFLEREIEHSNLYTMPREEIEKDHDRKVLLKNEAEMADVKQDNLIFDTKVSKDMIPKEEMDPKSLNIVIQTQTSELSSVLCEQSPTLDSQSSKDCVSSQDPKPRAENIIPPKKHLPESSLTKVSTSDLLNDTQMTDDKSVNTAVTEINNENYDTIIDSAEPLDSAHFAKSESENKQIPIGPSNLKSESTAQLETTDIKEKTAHLEDDIVPDSGKAPKSYITTHQQTIETLDDPSVDLIKHSLTTITKRRKRIIKHIQIVDGKEHVTEEVIEEPEEVEIVESDPTPHAHVLQEQGIKTKTLKIVRQVQIIDGNEHVIEQVIEDPDDEYVPSTTVLADIEIGLEKSDLTNVPKHIGDVTQKLLESEIEHSNVLAVEPKDIKQPEEIRAAEPEEKISTDQIQISEPQYMIQPQPKISTTELLMPIATEEQEVAKECLKPDEVDSHNLDLKNYATMKVESNKQVQVQSEEKVIPTFIESEFDDGKSIKQKLSEEHIQQHITEKNTEEPGYETVAAATKIIDTDLEGAINQEADQTCNLKEASSNIVSKFEDSFISKEKESLLSEQNIKNKSTDPELGKQIPSDEKEVELLIEKTGNTEEIVKNTEGSTDIAKEISLSSADQGKREENKSGIITECYTSQSKTEVEPAREGTVIIESDVNLQTEQPKISYIQQFETVEHEQKDEHPTPEYIKLTKDIQTPEKKQFQKGSDLKHDTNIFIQTERLDTHVPALVGSISSPEINNKTSKKDIPDKNYKCDFGSETENISQTVDIAMSLVKTDDKQETEPKIEMELKIENFEKTMPSVVKKDINIDLPTRIHITEEKQEDLQENLRENIKEKSDKSKKDHKKRSKKKQKQHEEEASKVLDPEPFSETEKSIADTESSSLGHYVQLSSPTIVESPKPSDSLLEMPKESECPEENISLSMVSDHNTEKGYEPEDVSVSQEDKKMDKQKKHKKRKAYAVSESTTYPHQTSTGDETAVSTPVEMSEPIQQRVIKTKKGKKKTSTEDKQKEVKSEPVITPISPKVGSEIVTSSPRDESYQTLSETPEANTVKIVEECVGSSPETIKREISTTVTYPVNVVEEIATTEYSMQTSPEIKECEIEEKVDISKVEKTDSELQTSPTPVSEILIQTVPIEDKEAHTQTMDNITIIEKVEVSDNQIQTSRSETPEEIVKIEMTTQVAPRDIGSSDNKFSQTSSPVVEQEIKIKETDNRDVQTSPEPQVQKDEKSTEIVIETLDTDIQTIKLDNVDQETSTSPTELRNVNEISIQTPEVSVVHSSTQSDLQKPEKVEGNIGEKLDTKDKITTVDSSQQTSPRRDDEQKQIVDMSKQEVERIDSMQQTSPRDDYSAPKPHSPVQDIREFVSVNVSQQTTPRDTFETQLQIKETIVKDNITVDNTQQTSPRFYSEDSISTSTDEPYEVHLRAQISVPQIADDFLENERQSQMSSQSILGDPQKQRKRKSKRKAESPLQSPGSLSDPINAELSLSVTPSSEDLSSKDVSSIDEGISQIVSPIHPISHDTNAVSKPTYSDVVQRSKSKSPSPSKTVITKPHKSEKEKLLETLERRTQSIHVAQKPSDDSMTVALIEPSVEKSYDLVVNKELEEVVNAINTNDPSKIDKSVIIVIKTISIWLEEIQYRIRREIITGQTSSDDTERIKQLENFVKRLKETICITEIHEETITLIETLTRQVSAVNTLNNQRPLRLDEEEKKWEKFLSEVDRLKHSVDKVKSNLDALIMSEATTQKKLEDLDDIENDNNDNVENVKKAFKLYRSLIESNPKLECPDVLYVCDDNTKQVENTINTERDRLLQLTSLAEEYEQTLEDFGQITDVAEALLDGKIIVSNLDHLHEEIQKHRKFFVNLSHCRAILESLENNLDNETRAKYSALHHSLHDRATTIIDRAASRAQQMTLAASRWSTLDQGMKQEQQWLIVAQQRIPDLSNVTSIDHEQYINLYQSISLDVSHHYAKMLRLMSITEGLQGLIICSGLENECSTALDTLFKLQEDIDSRLTRLTAFKETWITYDHLIDRIEGWMNLAAKELEHITPENITTTSNLRRFWELKAHHEVHNTLKIESGIQFEKALEILPISDEMVQRQFFSKIEDKWRDLSTRISSIHSSAIQTISDRDVPSNEKLTILEDEMRELAAMLDGLKGVIKSEDELNLYIERLQVMTGRIDRIQNELGRLSLLPTADSESLSALLNQSSLLDDQISEELERSLLLKEKLVQVQAGISRCQKSQRRAQQILEECESAERLESDVVERASQTCEKLIEDLSTQWRDILALRQALHTLPTSLRVCMSPLSVERDISALQESHSSLESACNDLSARLRARVALWRRFERQLELLQGAVREADYMVELLTVQGQVDYDRLLKATEKLETLSDSLSQRNGELVGALLEAARPLQAGVEDSVAARLTKDLDDATAAYHATCANLTQLCEKYNKAVDLWRRYRNAAAGVRAVAERQEAALHALRPHDAPAAHRACLEQEARVAELRSLAARVAAETGSRALQADADALARRLQLVAGAVQALADLGEARQLARAKAQQAKEMFCDMKQDLTPLHEDGEIVEDKLIALRENLIALGKSEADIAPAKAELPEIDREVSDEHSIVRILELWQAMFRDTFLHYHRLSTALVRSGDAATALRLWHEYLLDLQSFLSGTVPADYENLTEHRRLCRVHRNLLASQRSVLVNENRETKNKDLADKFDTLTNLHNETLARIVERHDEVCSRIAAWDDYRETNTELLRWLKEIEREKEKLQLRYVHIKRIHKILAKIQNLSERLPEGRKLSEKLLSNLKKVLDFTEDTYAASVRMEYAGIVKRVDNLQASLDTWRDFLTRILGLIGEYEYLTGDLVKLYTKSQSEVMSYSDENRLSRPQLLKAIEKYRDLRTKIDKTENQIEALSVIQEQLKECLSPQDMRIVNQKVWQLRQQRADLEHQLSIIIHRLQERVEVYTIFDSRLTRFEDWISTIESRLETTTSTSDIGALDPQDLIRRINSDIQAETALKEREFEWLAETGTALVELSKKDEKSYSKNTSKHLRDVQERWHKLQETGRSRIDKINELLETITQLEERLTELRLKLHTIEANLSASVVLEQLSTKAVDAKFQERDQIHKNIEEESGEVGKTLNLCELVFNDPDVIKGNFDLRNLRTGVDIVEKKWKNICNMSEQRKKSLKEIRKSAELTNSLLPKVEKKLDGIEKRIEKIEARKQRGEEQDDSVAKAIIKDLDSLESDLKKLEDAYSRIASARGVELRGDDAARLRTSVRRGQSLRSRVLSADADAHGRFVAAHGRAVVALAETDVRLTKALHLSPAPTDTQATLKELDGVEVDLRECEALVEEADRLAVVVSSMSGVSDMVSEYRALCADVRARLLAARASVVSDVEAAVQTESLRWETDASLQVDTLTSKETYRVELEAAVRETSDALEALRTALLVELKEYATREEQANAAKEIAKAGAKPEQTLELAKHLSELLLTECDATEEEAMLKEVGSLSLRYEDLLPQAKKRELQIQEMRLPHSALYALTCEHESGKLTCPQCTDRNWRQLDNDLWRLEQWLQFAEATEEARTDPPEAYEALEDVIQDHREFLLDLDSHKSLVVWLNLVGSHVAGHARREADGAAVTARLADANRRWDSACRAAAEWHGRLQAALINNREFHDIGEMFIRLLGPFEREEATNIHTHSQTFTIIILVG
ncbi:unnamed protein product [Danaus chrysippus]|uniref:(African queen) hypothetical protein n=1 Tax=Danaus chrysippus TaxID=151541 RepID=A0A8J2R0K3_9NEOP|nr:unnamed protein product [Danaus chrysippus]